MFELVILLFVAIMVAPEVATMVKNFCDEVDYDS